MIRVHEEIEAQQQSLPFETVYQADGTLELDTQAVTQTGQEGIQETRVRVRYENGFAVSARLPRRSSPARRSTA